VPDQVERDQLDLFVEDEAAAQVSLATPEELRERRELQRLSPDERLQGLLNVSQLRDRLRAGERVPYIPSRECRWCGSDAAELEQSGTQLPVRCRDCGRVSYNAPKAEVGLAHRSVRTLRANISPSQQARILERDHGRCVLCGTTEEITIGHLLSVADGMRVGATIQELNDDANLAAMCQACNIGLSDRSVSLLTYTILGYLLRAEVQRSHARTH
jgi:hypothetical protein